METQTVMSEDDLRRWLRGHVKRGQGAHAGKEDRELPTLAMLRAIGWNVHQDFYKWLNGKMPIPERHQRALTRFARAWDAGLLMFEKKGMKRELKRRTEPKRMPPKFHIQIDNKGARLQLVGRLSAPTRLAPMIDRKQK